ncbi:MAG: hypothetical protein ACOYEV_06205 [Candidatus Nanopelagicales bacterium]
MNYALLSGLLLGAGLSAVLAGTTTPAPDLRTALRRLGQADQADPPAPVSRSVAMWRRLTAEVAERSGLGQHSREMALLGTTPAALAGQMLAAGLAGLFLPPLAAAALAFAGSPLPLALPLVVSLLLGGVLFLLPRWELRGKATAARTDMRMTICAYLELVALERAADAGPVEALERAAQIGHGPGFEHVRRALMRARVDRRAPWQSLAELGDELGVTELRDVGDIMRLSGESGAAVLPSLRARAASLRIAILQAEVAQANAASERMAIPVALLGIVFMALLGYPALARIVAG